MLRSLTVLFGVALIVLLGYLLDAQSQTPIPPRAEAPVVSKVFAPGRIEGITQEIELRPQSRGQIVEIPVREGQLVEVGAVLIKLNSEQFEHELALAAAEVSLAESEELKLRNGARKFERDEALAMYRARVAEFDQAKLAYQRTQRLRTESAVSQQEADDQHSKMKSLEAQVQAFQARAELLAAPAREDELQMSAAKIAAAKSRLELAKVALDRCTLKAVTSGQVLRVNVEAGELAGPDSKEPTLVMADTSRCRVRAFVEELDAPRVQIGMTASIVADGLPDRHLVGRISQLSPQMSAKQIWSDDPDEKYDTKAREIWIDLDDSSDLVIGLRVDVLVDLLDARVK